jgi:hypothetical protein
MKVLSCVVIAVLLSVVLSQIEPAPAYTIVNYSTEIKLFSNGTDGNPCAVQVTEIIEYEFNQDLDNSVYHLERIIPKNLGSYGLQTVPTISSLEIEALDEAVEVVNFTAISSVPSISFDFQAEDPDLLDETIPFKLTYIIHGILHIDAAKKINILKWGQQIPSDASITQNKIAITMPEEWTFEDGELIANTVSGPIKLDSAEKIVFESNDVLDFSLQFPLRASSCPIGSDARTMGLASPFHYYHPHSTWLIGGGVGFVLLLACIGSFCCLGYLLLNEDSTTKGRKKREKLEPLLADDREAQASYVNINRGYKAPGATLGQQRGYDEEYVNEPVIPPSGGNEIHLASQQPNQQPLLDFESVQVQGGNRNVEQEPVRSFEEIRLSPERAAKRNDNV